MRVCYAMSKWSGICLSPVLLIYSLFRERSTPILFFPCHSHAFTYSHLSRLSFLFFATFVPLHEEYATKQCTKKKRGRSPSKRARKKRVGSSYSCLVLSVHPCAHNFFLPSIAAREYIISRAISRHHIPVKCQCLRPQGG